MRISSGFSCSTSFWSTRAMARGSRFSSDTTRMARSAPIASPVRSCSCAVLGPMLTSTTSEPACFSFRRSPSSIAISSNGFTTHLTLSVTNPVPSAVILSCVSGSGTRFTVTRIFTGGLSFGGNSGTETRFRYTARFRQSRKAGLRRRPSACLAAADVEAETAREITAGLQHQGRELLVDALGLEAVGGSHHRERANHVARVVADRHRHGADVLHVLAHVDGVAVRRHRLELLLEGLAIDRRPLGELRQRIGKDGAQVLLGLEGEERLTSSRAVQRQGLTHLRHDADGAICLDDLHRHHAVATENRHVGRLTRLADELDHDRSRLTEQPHVAHVALSQLEAAHPEAVVLGGAVLLDVATRLERGE